MTMPVPPADDQPTYVDPVTGQPLYVDPATGQLAYTDPTSVAPTVPYPAAGYTPSGYPPSAYPQVSYPTSPVDPSIPQTGFTAPAYTPGGYAPSAYGYPGYTGYPVGAVTVQNRTNPLAITSMILSICGIPMLFCYGFGGVLALAGAIIGHVSRRQIKARTEAGDGMALAGIIIGWIVVVVAIVVVGFIVWAVTHIDEWAPSDPYPYTYPS
jgi:hypothetical protein